MELRTAVERGDLTQLEGQSIAFKSAVYQQAQRYGDAGDLAAALADLRGEIGTLRGQAVLDTGRVSVSQSGVFSGQVDGYESILLPETLEELTPQDLDGLEEKALPTGAHQLGKLITSSTWYFVCPLSEEEARRLSLGDRVTVRFSRDWSGEVEMTVDHMGTVQNNQLGKQ